MTHDTSPGPISLPEPLASLMPHRALVCEYASIKRDGTPIMAPMAPFLGQDGHTIDIATGLTYPLKADRARKNPRVCLLFSEPTALLADNPPTILVYGHATVYDADLQANLDRYTRVISARSPTFARSSPFLLRRLSGYLARIWISVTPLKVLWWPAGDLAQPPREWLAPPGTQAPPSDPPPRPLAAPHKTVIELPADWRPDMTRAISRMRPPILTVVDQDGYPVPFRVRATYPEAGGVRLELPAAMPAEAQGRACLTFYTLQVKNNEMVANQAITFIGDVAAEQGEALFTVERQLPNLGIQGGLRGTLSTISEWRRMGKRAEAEAGRRGQRAPKVNL